jgi:prevent-host-death family protein
MGLLNVTSAQLQKAFGRYREVALRQPVVITNHGRESLVLLSADEYRRLRSQDRQAITPADLTDAEIAALERGEDVPEAAAFDHEVDS